MRIGEVKNIIGAALDESKQLVLQNDAVYGGQAYLIKNYDEVFKALSIIAEQEWNSATGWSEILKIYNDGPVENPGGKVVAATEFSQLTSYVNQVNQKIPLYFSVIESITEKQDEKIINICLPKNIDSLTALSQINERLEAALKLFNVDGQFEFKGFDKGTEWYVILATGILSHQYLISCCKVAQEYLKARTEFFVSEKARISYEASLVKDSKATDEGYDEHKKAWLEIFIDKEVRKVIEEIKATNGKTDEELHSFLLRGTKALVKELGEGTEFHLSLNPPKYAREQGGSFEIDYKKIQSLTPVKKKEAAQLPAPEKKEE